MTGMNMVSNFSSPIRLRLGAITGHCLAQWEGTSTSSTLSHTMYAVHQSKLKMYHLYLTWWSTLWITYSEGQFLAPEDPDSRDAAVIVCAEQDDTGKGVLSEFVQALEHTCWKTAQGLMQWVFKFVSFLLNFIQQVIQTIDCHLPSDYSLKAPIQISCLNISYF